MLISIQMKKKEEFLYSEIETALRNDLWKKKNHWNLLSLIREFRDLPRKCVIQYLFVSIIKFKLHTLESCWCLFLFK